MLKLYCEKRNGKQNDLLQALRTRFPDAEVIYKPYRIDANYLNKLVTTQQLLTWLLADRLLPDSARDRCIAVLTNAGCPTEFKVAMKPLSCDFVLERDGVPYYWESHEEQHKRLSDNRKKPLYDPDGNRFEVPRGLQRLVRDVWRALYLRPYTIVWRNRTDNSPMTYVPELVDGFHEFPYPREFSFKGFCGL